MLAVCRREHRSRRHDRIAGKLLEPKLPSRAGNGPVARVTTSGMVITFGILGDPQPSSYGPSAAYGEGSETKWSWAVREHGLRYSPAAPQGEARDERL
jgi:hypothetical protein